MKKALLTTLGVAAIGMASYAASYMHVETADGKVVEFNIENVTEVDFMTEEITDYVDLDLPSGTLWAACNIGATKPEEFGDKFAWGETSPKEVYDWSTYKWGNGKNNISKYNLDDGLKTLLSEDDAATANWGSDWRMPTFEELQELINNCKYALEEVNGVSGAKFTASNGKFIFLPCLRGYHSSSIEGKRDCAYFLYFDKRGAQCKSDASRYNGFPVRAVRAKK